MPRAKRPIDRSIAPKGPLSWTCVCAHCERIRRTEGWRSPEPGECEGTVLTHDLCPDCIRELYPGYAAVANRLQEAEISLRSISKQKTQTP